tara:strand:- start:1351 stop:2823 length:1473 start_codon:yes stop_codon:yes gene_type:complete
MSSYQVILGNQLFYPFNHLNVKTPIIMIEHYDLCAYFKFHKIKITFFFSAMRHYRDELMKAGYNVTYYEFNKKEKKSYFELLYSLMPAVKTINIIEIIDHQVANKFNYFCKSKNLGLNITNSPMFLNDQTIFSDYLNTVKKPFMKTFYERSRINLKILVEDDLKPIGGKWSFDAENRKKCPLTVQIPKRQLASKTTHVNEVIKLVNQEFPDHPGNASDSWLPVTRRAALLWWDNFKVNYFEQFGDYEDAIDNRDPFLFHSTISPLLNIGLLTPKEIIEDAVQLLERVPMNSLEGFIRQIMGWREFIRGIYDHYDDDQQSLNFFNLKRKLNNVWYEGNSGHLPLDDAIKTTIKFGYNHHIERLMIIGSTMLCCDIHPQEAYRWFMEMYVDGADWVMGPNVFGMSQFSDGGIFATKPYICGSNYIRKMSHYGKGDWCDIADGLYWRFIDQHQEFFLKNPRMSMVSRTLGKMAAEKKSRLFKAANQFIEKVSK